jgi:hypothetical protein
LGCLKAVLVLGGAFVVGATLSVVFLMMIGRLFGGRVSKPNLTVDRLLRGGFSVAGCWELISAREIANRVYLPTQAGVYAFEIVG